MLADWQQRVIDELAQLDERRRKLGDFTVTPTFRALPTVERELLWSQLSAMADYANCLKARIEGFK